jgi:hypothetical protein
MARKKRTTKQFLDDIEANGLEAVVESHINSDRVYKML